VKRGVVAVAVWVALDAAATVLALGWILRRIF